MRLLAAILILCANRPANGQAVPDTAARHLIALEHEWNDAILRNDSTAAGSFMADEWTEITSAGSVLTRTEDLKSQLKGHPFASDGTGLRWLTTGSGLAFQPSW